MPQLGDYTFRDETTRVLSDLRLVEQRLRREVSLIGMLTGFTSRAALLNELALLEREIEAFVLGRAQLRLTEGRYLLGKVLRYRKTVDEAERAAAFRLVLLSEDRYERSVALHEEEMNFVLSGQQISLENAGTAHSLPTLSLTATGDLVEPRISDGERTLTYNATLPAGAALTLDCDAHTAAVEGANVLHAIAGGWPRLAPGSTTLTYTDAPASTHSGTLVARYRDFWA